MSHKNRVLRLSKNTEGRDFVVGDIHGCFFLVDRALAIAQFDETKDRLIVVGDLVDRGPESHEVYDFLQRPYVYSVRGNHDDVVMHMLGSNDNFYKFGFPQFYQYFNSRSLNWLGKLKHDQAMKIRQVFEDLPVLIELETDSGVVGIVHADVPEGLSWQEFVQKVNDGDPDTLYQAIWSRRRVLDNDQSGVPGITRVFMGHTAGDQIRQRGNCFFIDTGAVFKDYAETHSYAVPLIDPHLTLTKADADEADLNAPRAQDTGEIINVVGADEPDPNP
ncbi:MAG: metallophosphoesterase [Alphaproteobacteria bacterium]|nr:metallophosphoesterase [Alphaproteobacteria bacterium]MCD8519906.1 metallophosphoesterase [Alphaproteobacteria bacterium]MCD8570885.1 metallophosphoesterase [Alphaproteobacteria bacterium]